MEEGFSSPIEEREDTGPPVFRLRIVFRTQKTEGKGKKLMGKTLSPPQDSCYLTKVGSPQQQKADALLLFCSSGAI